MILFGNTNIFSIVFIRYKYTYGRWGRCSRCGRVGIRKRQLYCTKIKEGEKPIKVENEACQHLAKPTTEVKCYRYCPSKNSKKWISFRRILKMNPLIKINGAYPIRGFYVLTF